MKKLILLLLIILPLILSGQQIATTTESQDTQNIYYVALSNYISLLESSDLEKMYLEYNSITTATIPIKIRNTLIYQVSNIELKKLTKKKKTFTLYRIVPIRYTGSTFFVNIIPYKVERKRRNFNYTNQGGKKIEFKYDCNQSHLIMLP